MHGHAIEARIYAENPAKGFLPSTGTLRHLRAPRGIEFAVGGNGAVRVDSGVRQGDAITPHYDPMIAKLIVWGEDRAIALGRMRAALAGLRDRRRLDATSSSSRAPWPARPSPPPTSTPA